MKLPLRFLVPALAFAVLVGFFVVGLRSDPGQIPSPLIGRPAPAFALESLGDPAWTVGSADFAGRPWLLNVWGTWCVGCRQEHEALMAIAEQARVPMMGLNLWDKREPALRWLAELGNPYVSVAFDPEGRTAIDWGVYGAPETFLIDGSGLVVKKHIGPITPDVWEHEFLPLLAGAERGP
jgi:cytochrome c biogenesis protein CcmG/thiol:disulfide interchange protein DsbE